MMNVKGNIMVTKRQLPLEQSFWERFPEFCMDDPEDKHNGIIALLRSVAQNYFRHYTERYEEEKRKALKPMDDLHAEEIKRALNV